MTDDYITGFVVKQQGFYNVLVRGLCTVIYVILHNVWLSDKRKSDGRKKCRQWQRLCIGLSEYDIIILFTALVLQKYLYTCELTVGNRALHHHSMLCLSI